VQGSHFGLKTPKRGHRPSRGRARHSFARIVGTGSACRGLPALPRLGPISGTRPWLALERWPKNVSARFRSRPQIMATEVVRLPPMLNVRNSVRFSIWRAPACVVSCDTLRTPGDTSWRLQGGPSPMRPTRVHRYLEWHLDFSAHLRNDRSATFQEGPRLSLGSANPKIRKRRFRVMEKQSCTSAPCRSARVEVCHPKSFLSCFARDRKRWRIFLSSGKLIGRVT